MFGFLCDLQSSRRTSDGMHVDRVRDADIALIRHASDRARLKVVDIQGDTFLAEDAGTISWFNPLVVDSHAQILFDAMHFTVRGRLFTRRLVSPTGASVSAVCGGKRWRKTVVEFAASHPGLILASPVPSNPRGIAGRITEAEYRPN